MAETSTDVAAPQRLSERDLQRQVIDLAAVYGYVCYHTQFSIRSMAGYPDLTCVGQTPEQGCLWLELKTAKGTVTPAQHAWIARLRAAGQRAMIVRPDDLETLRAVLAGETRNPATGTGGTGEDGR